VRAGGGRQMGRKGQFFGANGNAQHTLRQSVTECSQCGPEATFEPVDSTLCVRCCSATRSQDIRGSVRKA
jgi:hypothetical protein